MGINEICFEAFFVDFPAVVGEPEECLLINREKPKVTAHVYVDDDPEIVEGEINEFYNDFIEFRLDLEYNDSYNYGDDVQVTAYLKKEDGTILHEIPKSNTTLQGFTNIIVPDESAERFYFELDPYFDEPLHLCFDAKFSRPGLENPYEYTTCNNPVIIIHPT